MVHTNEGRTPVDGILCTKFDCTPNVVVRFVSSLVFVMSRGTRQTFESDDTEPSFVLVRTVMKIGGSSAKSDNRRIPIYIAIIC
ncbi:Uncharacterized protein BM_BM17374 [Brugia malayi]|uniref:Uncharacterized protein n=1 Tax=Brugia malayi TaxID=6279 RepID=A0A4E9F4P9_BRUMA|nr:Uncharacterized protein BM_BM17374 [Brugia malayi]VIO90874.1 Uncharacterized protein BM_BM17374 [Brugia malayi]